MNDKLTDENFLIYCAKHYVNRQYSTTEEFIEDINRIKYIKKLLTRYTSGGDLKERLILNHIIILNNVFGPEALCKILFLKLENKMYCVKPFLILINILPDKIYDVGEHNIIDTDLIDMDQNIINRLRKL